MDCFPVVDCMVIQPLGAGAILLDSDNLRAAKEEQVPRVIVGAGVIDVRLRCKLHRRPTAFSRPAPSNACR